MSIPLRFSKVKLEKPHLDTVHKLGIEEYFKHSARKVALMRLYDRFYATGWTFSLAHKVRTDLMPEMIEVVATVWYMAMHEAGLTTRVSHASN